MKILLWVIVGILTALGIARINQSNKLFWILFTSFMVGIAGSSLYVKLNEPSEDVTTQVYSTQVSNGTLDTSLLASDIPTTPSCYMPNPVGQSTPDSSSYNFTTSKGYVSLRTQPPINHKRLCTDFSTHHDDE